MSNLQTVPTSAKYGLVKKQGELSGPALAKHQQQQSRFGMALGRGRGSTVAGRGRPPPRREGGALGGVFRADDSGDELDTGDGGGGAIAAVNRDLMRAAAVSESQQAALSAADAACFDYDGEYDSFKRAAGAALGSHALNQSTAAPAPQSRYVNSLKATAAVREKEKDRIYERKLLRERLEEEKTLGIKAEEEPKYITSAYKKKLMEEQKWDYEDRLNDEVERRNDVTTKRDGMSGFYAGLLTKNIAYGGDVSAATSAYTAGSARQAQYMAEGGPAGAGQLSDTSAHTEAAVSGKEVVPAAPNGGDGGAPDSRKRPLAVGAVEGDGEAEVPAASTAAVESAGEEVSEEERRQQQERRREEAVAAARARFLERKRQKTA